MPNFGMEDPLRAPSETLTLLFNVKCFFFLTSDFAGARLSGERCLTAFAPRPHLRQMSVYNRFFSSRLGIIITGAVIGVLAVVLVELGNPANMGVCVACFTRDTAGALGLHRAAAVQYIRPEIVGLLLGSLLAALISREFKPRGGSSPLVRFVLGMFAMVGALVFLGCPWRLYLRLSGGDWNAFFGLLGLIVGVGFGIVLLKIGYSLGRSRPAPWASGWVAPLVVVALLLFLIFLPQLGRDEKGNPTGPIFSTSAPESPSAPKPPGSLRAPLLASLGIAGVMGFLLQRSNFCTVGAIRDLILLRDFHLFSGIVALLLVAFLANLAFGQFRAGFEGQPVAHTDSLWNFAGMVLSGLAFTLAGGCPGRQFVLSGTGDTDAFVFVLGMLFGAGFAHNFTMASSSKGPGVYGPAAVVAGLVFCIIVGLTMREKKEA